REHDDLQPDERRPAASARHPRAGPRRPHRRSNRDRRAAGAAARRFSFRDFVDYRERATTLEDLAGVNLATLLLTADNRTDQLIGEIASARYLSLRGIRVTQGRLLTDDDDRPAAPPVAIISDALWRR